MIGATSSAIAKAYKSRSMSKGPKRSRLRRGGTSRLRRIAARSRRGFGRSTPIHRRDGTLNPKAYPKKGGWGAKAQRALISRAKEGKGMEAAKTKGDHIAKAEAARKARRASRQSSVAGSKAARLLKIRKAQKAAGSAGNSPAAQPLTKTHGARKIAVQRLKGKTAKRGNMTSKRRSKKFLKKLAKFKSFSKGRKKGIAGAYAAAKKRQR